MTQQSHNTRQRADTTQRPSQPQARHIVRAPDLLCLQSISLVLVGKLEGVRKVGIRGPSHEGVGERGERAAGVWVRRTRPCPPGNGCGAAMKLPSIPRHRSEESHTQIHTHARAHRATYTCVTGSTRPLPTAKPARSNPATGDLDLRTSTRLGMYFLGHGHVDKG